MQNNMPMPPRRAKRELDPKKLKEIQMKQGGRGPGGRFSGVKEKPKNRKATIKRLIKYISSSKFLFISMIVMSLILTLANLLSTYMVKDVTNSITFSYNENGVITSQPDVVKFRTSLILLASFYCAYCLLQFISSLLGAYLSVRTVRKMRNDLFNKVVYLPISYIDTHPHGDIMSRMTNDVDNVSNAISQSISSLVSGVITLIGCLALMIWYSPLLTLISFIVLGLTMAFTLLSSKYMRPLFVKQQKLLGALNTQTEEMVTGCKTVIAYNRQLIAEMEFNEQSELLTKAGMKAQIIGGSMGPVMNFIGNLGYFMVCIFGAIFLTKHIGGPIYDWNGLEIGIVVMFLTLTKQFVRPINEIAQLYSSILTALAGAERVFKVLDEESEDFSSQVEFNPEEVVGDIDFKNIEFSYVPGKQILNKFNVDVRHGHKIALVGATGSGKTTIVNLLLRFYDINAGEIDIDGVDISKISKKDLRDCVSIVLQDPILFGDTIENNIKYGRENATDEEIDYALQLANCDSFISRLPEGKKTILTEGATNISQGQRQLLTIARAVLANPKILILDEATSSVDTRTEKHIQDAMVKLMENRTSIIIAHRLSTIQDADLIVVLDQGKVREMGNHRELLELNGQYAKLYNTQFSGLET